MHSYPPGYSDGEASARSASSDSQDVHGSQPNPLTIAEICGIPIMRGVQVSAGESGIENLVTRLNVMTLPEVAEWTKPQELLLTTGYPLPRETSALVALISDLNDRAVSGLAIKLNEYTPEIPYAVKTKANEIGFPILTLPQSVAIDDILSTVLTLIANNQAEALARARDVHDRLLEASLRGNLDDVLFSLSTGLDGAGVVISDHDGLVLAHTLSESDKSLLAHHSVLHTETDTLRLDLKAGDGMRESVATRPLSGADHSSGHLLAIRPDSSFTSHDHMIIDQAAMVAALRISKSTAVHEVTKRFADDALRTLLTGTDRQVHELLAHPIPLDWNLDQTLHVMCGYVPEDVDTGARRRIIALWNETVCGFDSNAPVGLVDNLLVAVLGTTRAPETIGRSLATRISRTFHADVAVGISDEMADPRELRTAWQHAQIAVSLASTLDERPHVRRYESLGLIRLVSATSNATELDRFVDTMLGPVLTLPETERGEMLETLRSLFEFHCNVAETARSMHFHYNTIRYRVRKLEQLLGNFIHDSRLRLHLGVALEILPLRARSEE